jgi:hypothetical protein
VINPEEIQLLREENAVLRAQIEWLKKQLFGAGKSEKFDRAQLLLKLAELEKLSAAAEAPKQTITYERTNAPREKRPLAAETFAKLPVKETIEIIPEPVQAEPEAFEKIGEERAPSRSMWCHHSSSSARSCGQNLSVVMIVSSPR